MLEKGNFSAIITYTRHWDAIFTLLIRYTLAVSNPCLNPKYHCHTTLAFVHVLTAVVNAMHRADLYKYHRAFTIIPHVNHWTVLFAWGGMNRYNCLKYSVRIWKRKFLSVVAYLRRSFYQVDSNVNQTLQFFNHIITFNWYNGGLQGKECKLSGLSLKLRYHLSKVLQRAVLR